MSHHHSHISSAIKIIESYTATEPFASHLKKHFAANKKYGSKDRKTIAALCYNYFRLAHALKNKTTEEKILAGLFLCEYKASPLLQALQPELNNKITLSLEEKSAFLNIDLATIFPFSDELNEGLNSDSFYKSFLQQPRLFLRLRPGKEKAVVNKLTEAGIPFILQSSDCIQIVNVLKFCSKCHLIFANKKFRRVRT